MKKSFYAFFIVFLAFIASTSFAETISGKVIGVHDGDTITLLDDTNHQTKVRLAEIDAPELNQPYGNKAKEALSGLIFGKNVKVAVVTKDRYRRTVGRIYQGEVDVNLKMVEEGGAWAYQHYLTDKNIGSAEETAKAARVGLWALQEDQRIAPWAWRHPKKTVATSIQHEASQEHTLPHKSGFSCSGKALCREMKSCLEAKFYLTSCGLNRLDGDHDGIPCESLCK